MLVLQEDHGMGAGDRQIGARLLRDLDAITRIEAALIAFSRNRTGRWRQSPPGARRLNPGNGDCP